MRNMNHAIDSRRNTMLDGNAQAVPGGYGTLEQNPIDDAVRATREAIDHQEPVWLDDPRLAKITRLRLVTDPGFPLYDVSYCYGELADGTPVRVNLPWHQLRKGRGLQGDLIQMCREAKVYAKGLGLLDPATISVIC
jgi:hypothetical protein